MIGAPARQKGALRHRERQLPVRHTFSLSQRTLLFSRCSLGHGRGPRARGRCSVTHAPSFLRITYLYLELVRARRVTRDQTDRRSIDMHMHDSLHCAHASKNATERRLKEGSLSWLFDRLHACRANPLHARSRVFRMVSDTPVLRFLPLPCPDISIDWYSKFQRWWWWWWWHFWNGRIFRWISGCWIRGFEFKSG